MIDFNKINEDNKNFYLLVAGSRKYNDYLEMSSVLDFVIEPYVLKNKHIIIVSGGAGGADRMAERYADEHKYEKHIMPADWNKYGKSAGYRRNKDMHLYISSPSHRKRECICFWSSIEKSKGTAHNFKIAKEFNNPLKVYDYSLQRFLSEDEINVYSNM